MLSSFTSRISTLARLGPRAHQSKNNLNCSSSPSASMYTSSLGSLRTKPFKPNRSARSFADARKKTPCTFPETRMFKCFIAMFAFSSAKSSSLFQFRFALALYFFYAIGHGQVFLHVATNVFNGLAHFLTYFIVRLVGFLFSLNIFPL